MELSHIGAGHGIENQKMRCLEHGLDGGVAYAYGQRARFYDQLLLLFLFFSSSLGLKSMHLITTIHKNAPSKYTYVSRNFYLTQFEI